ncbi:hypothetical protein [uncultured Paraglaciecola sp.]|uniref:hypothetical protein n=1 Tax=uncultured Paraglaciecola sp. TaxID=1765024 RepID=UPI00261FBCA4|nr:hypothetical protein [uncultured Paraglaciecola sp.]
MTDKPPNPPAFPNPLAASPAGDMQPPYDMGMTLRDYFAAHSGITFDDAVKAFDPDVPETFDDVTKRLVKMQRHYADLMLAARDEDDR